jgi:hypothetical protein
MDYKKCYCIESSDGILVCGTQTKEAILGLWHTDRKTDSLIFVQKVKNIHSIAMNY